MIMYTQLTQMELADELAAKLSGRCVFNVTQGKWFCRMEPGAEWKEDRTFVQEEAKRVAWNARQGATDSDKRYFGSFNFVRGIISLAKSDPLVAVTEDEMRVLTATETATVKTAWGPVDGPIPPDEAFH